MSSVPLSTSIEESSSAERFGGGKAVVNTVFNKFGILLFNAATGIITARALRPQGRGELAAMILWPLFLAFVTSLGIPSSLIYMLKTYPDRREDHVASGILLSLIFGICAAVAGGALLPIWLGHEYAPNIIFFARLFLVVTPLLALIQTGRAIMEANGHFSHSNQLQVMYPATSCLGLVALLLLHRLTPISAAMAYIGAAVPNFAVMAYRLRPLFGIRRRPDLGNYRLILGYGFRSYGIDLLGTLALQMDQVLVIRMLSAAEMGAYGVVLSLSRMFNLFQASIVMVLFPKASGRSLNEVLALTARCARIGTAVTAVCSFVVSIVGGPVLGLLYGKEYADNVACLRVLLLEVTLSGCVFILAQAFMALGRPGIVSILQGIGLSLSIPLMLILVPKYGVMGAAISLLISTVARLLFVYAGFRLFLNAPFPDLVPQREDLEQALALLSRSYPARRAA